MKWSLKGNTRLLIAVCSVTSAAAGATAGYVGASKYLEKKFQERLHEEIQEAKAYYQQMYSTPVLEREDPPEDDSAVQLRTEPQQTHDGVSEDLVGRALDAHQRYDATDDEEEQAAKQPPTVINIFQSHVPPGEEVLAALLADRDPEKPYIITKEEYYQNEPDNEQLAFTYWEGDEVLVDDREEFNPIDDIERVAGEDNLYHFGYGSEDENIVYIRNMTVHPPMDLCVTRSSGKYGVEVAGEDPGPHLEHSRDRKFRLHLDE